MSVQLRRRKPRFRHAEPRSRRNRKARIVSAALGVIVAGSAAEAITNWVVGLGANSSGQAQSSNVQNLTVVATATPAAGNLLYPGGNGDVVISISNPNPFPVTITALNLPTSTTYADGYTTSGLSTLQSGCAAATPSLVAWNYATGTSGSVHTLTSPVTVGASSAANNPLVVTLTNDAQMGSSAPSACQNTYFKMPSFTGIAATGGAATSTTSPATNAWAS